MLKKCNYCGSFKKANDDRRYIIIGDVHGCLSELKKLWNKLRPTSADKIIFLGDLVDKGPDSDGVVTFVREKKESGFNITLIEGNHEHKRITKFYKATSDTVYTADDPWVSAENIAFIEKNAIPYYRFKSGNKSFMCVHGGIYPAFKQELMPNKELASMYSGTRKAYSAFKALSSSLNLLEKEIDKLNSIPEENRTSEDRQRLKVLPSEIEIIKKDMEELQETKVLSDDIKEHLNQLKLFFLTRYVDYKGDVIPLNPVTLKPSREGKFWTETYKGEYGTVFYGHQPYDDVTSTDHTHGIDTSAVFGGKLTAAIVQNGEINFASQKSEKMYKAKHKFAGLYVLREVEELLNSNTTTINPYFEKVAKSGYKPSNEGLWQQAIAYAKRTYKKWPSAYASLGAAKKYKALGGKWKRVKTADLRRWLAEKWIREDGKPCGREDADGRVSKEKYPYCRPAKKISEDTPKTWNEMSASEKASKKREKAKVQKSSKGKKPSRVTPTKRKD